MSPQHNPTMKRTPLGALALLCFCALPLASALRAQNTPAAAAGTASGQSAQDANAAHRASETNKPATVPAKGGTTAQGSKATTAAPEAQGPSLPRVAGEPLDQVVAIVNGKLVLDSDVDEERRFEQLQPYLAPPGGYTRDRAIERMINRDLILQQAELQPGQAISDDDVARQIDQLRKEIPACKQYACETQAGWQRYLTDHGFTPSMFQERWKGRMQVLAFIEERFRSGVSITPAEIKGYYEKTFAPEYTRQSQGAPPSLDKVSQRIQELLLQQQVSALLGDWLRSLRAQGGVIVLHPGEDAP